MTVKKNKVAVFAFFLILVVGVLSGVVVAGLFGGIEKSDGHIEAVDFTCHESSEYAFVFPVKVDLSDGMDSDEAIVVARCLYEVCMNQTNYEVKSVQSSGDGVWTVYLLWGSDSPRASGELENRSHYFNVHVNVADRTVEYDRCY
jgi:hypothetical protein